MNQLSIELLFFSNRVNDFTKLEKMLRFLLRAKQKGKVHEMHNSSARVMEHNSQNMTLIGLGRLKDDNNRN